MELRGFQPSMVIIMNLVSKRIFERASQTLAEAKGAFFEVEKSECLNWYLVFVLFCIQLILQKLNKSLSAVPLNLEVSEAS